MCRCIHENISASLTWLLVVIGLDATNVGWLLRHESSHQISQTCLELSTSLGNYVHYYTLCLTNMHCTSNPLNS